MKVPVVLSTVHVDVDEGGQLLIDINGEPYAEDRQSVRADLRSILDKITADLGTAVRVEIREADGATYADIATPPQAPDGTPPVRGASSPPRPGLCGTGFRPGEEVAVAYVVCTQAAGADGQTTVRLPPALLASRGRRLVLIGMASGAVAQIAQSR